MDNNIIILANSCVKLHFLVNQNHFAKFAKIFSHRTVVLVILDAKKLLILTACLEL